MGHWETLGTPLFGFSTIFINCPGKGALDIGHGASESLSAVLAFRKEGIKRSIMFLTRSTEFASAKFRANEIQFP